MPRPNSPAPTIDSVKQLQELKARNRWRRQLRYFYHRFVRIQGKPEAIARGLAAGVFAGWFPLFGLQIILGIAIATAVRGNKIMAAAGTWVSNPFTYVPIYAFNFQVGQWVLRSGQESYGFGGLQSWQEVMSLGADFLFTLVVGCFVVGIVGAIVSYFAGLRIVRYVRQQQQLRRCQKRLKKQL
ncbi:DUF2062 domain-containing protein [Oculatella sp. LEGE 06141]|uniref:DUF2062 domain-containing protein n=1 Tax=Oculatella sp. LEGE 06141 TaxID=1828648 RepID=UPI00187FCDAC|nr:DUF2062 domain-containing protein [Oculatella sp. LEGE 06141]MBE9178245.1 DUF2062 domain-containing protein [Oculatella sp. LEGE 06141]